MIHLYGIKNCDTIKKTRHWFENAGVPIAFHDYKTEQPDKTLIARAIKEKGWDVVLNTKGTTWRKLDEKTRESMNETKALALALENPSVLKRPMIVKNTFIHIGYDEAVFERLKG